MVQTVKNLTVQRMGSPEVLLVLGCSPEGGLKALRVLWMQRAAGVVGIRGLLELLELLEQRLLDSWLFLGGRESRQSMERSRGLVVLELGRWVLC